MPIFKKWYNYGNEYQIVIESSMIGKAMNVGHA